MKVIDNVCMIPTIIFNYMLLRYKKVQVGKKCCVEGKLRIYGKAKKFSIGDDIRIISCRKSNPLGGQIGTTFALGKDAIISIGDKSGISNSIFRIETSLEIGKNVNIGGDCKFYDSDMHSIDYYERIQNPDTTIKRAPIVIEDGVWIGAHSIILKGVTIGKRSVIAAGSVVTKNIPQNELWAGNPAHFIRKINLEKCIDN